MSRIILKPATRQAPVAVELRPAGGTVGDFLAALDGQPPQNVHIVPFGPAHGRLRVGARVRVFHFWQDSAATYVWIDGRTHRFEAVSALRRGDSGPAARAASGEVHAPMPGTVLKVQVRPGDEVVADQPLVVMISMKMEMTLASPMAGRVLEVACVEGALVEMNAVLVRIQELPDGAAS